MCNRKGRFQLHKALEILDGARERHLFRSVYFVLKSLIYSVKQKVSPNSLIQYLVIA